MNWLIKHTVLPIRSYLSYLQKQPFVLPFCRLSSLHPSRLQHPTSSRWYLSFLYNRVDMIYCLFILLAYNTVKLTVQAPKEFSICDPDLRVLQTWVRCIYVHVRYSWHLLHAAAAVCTCLPCPCMRRAWEGSCHTEEEMKKSIIQQSIYHNLNINDGFPMVTLTTPKNTQSINQWRLHFQLIFCSFKSSFSISSNKYTHILLWCLYYLFRLSFWRHPFTEVDLWIVSISPNLLRWRINLIYVLDGLRVSKCSAIFHF